MKILPFASFSAAKCPDVRAVRKLHPPCARVDAVVATLRPPTLKCSTVILNRPAVKELKFPSWKMEHGFRRAAVLVFWTNSTPAATERFRRLYAALGFHTLSFHPHIGHLWAPSLAAAMARSVVKALADLSGHFSHFHLHLFSGAPTVILPHLVGVKLPIPFTSVVFDSAPVEFTKQAGLAAVRLIPLNPLVAAAVGAAGTAVNFFIGATHRAAMEKALSSDLLNVRQLYFASLDDDVARSDFVAGVAEGQKRLGREVEVVLWARSGHVQHHRLHRDEYEGALRTFLAVPRAKL
jgi:hypothetical protein